MSITASPNAAPCAKPSTATKRGANASGAQATPTMPTTESALTTSTTADCDDRRPATTAITSDAGNPAMLIHASSQPASVGSIPRLAKMVGNHAVMAKKQSAWLPKNAVTERAV